MREVKYCQKCGKIISKIEESDWYRHMSVKYCSDCRRKSDQEKTLERVHALRRRKKLKDKFRDEQLELLKEENELLKKNIIRMREQQQ